MESSDSQSAGGKAKSLRRSSRLSDSRSSILSGVIAGVVGPDSELEGAGRGGVDAVINYCRSDITSRVSVVGGESVKRSSPSLAPPPFISLPLITSTVERRKDGAIVRAAGRGDLAEVIQICMKMGLV